MSSHPRRLLLLWLVLGLLISLPLQAHKLKVFASAEGDRILGQAYFVGGAGAGGAKVTLTDTTGRELARLQPDESGNFSHRVDRRMDYQVVANSRDGHVARWTLRADEFSPGLPGVMGEATSAGDTTVAERPTQAISPTMQIGADGVPTVQIEQAVARQIRPLRVELMALEEQVRLRDVIGGIGYIFGLAGLGFWWSARRRGGER